MANIRKPTQILELRGAYKENPQRRAEREDELDRFAPITKDVPDYMTEGQRKCYVELIERCHPDVLGIADGAVVEMTACLLDEFRDAPRKMHPAKLARMQSGLSHLGMTPADRSRVSTLKRNAEKSKYAKFAA